MLVEVRLGMIGGAVVVAESGCMALGSAKTGAESEPESEAEAEGEANDEA